MVNVDKNSLLTTRQVASTLNISRNTLQRLIKKGFIKGATFKDGRGQKFWTLDDLEEVRKYLNSPKGITYNKMPELNFD